MKLRQPDDRFGSKAVRLRASERFPVCASKQTRGVYEYELVSYRYFFRLQIGGWIRSDVSALAAGRAGEERLDVGYPDIVGPPIRIHVRAVTALVVAAIDDDVGILPRAFRRR